MIREVKKRSGGLDLAQVSNSTAFGIYIELRGGAVTYRQQLQEMWCLARTLSATASSLPDAGKCHGNGKDT